MALDARKNFAISTVTIVPSPAASGTTLTVGDGSIFPAASFNAVVWPTAANPTNSNAEIVRVTNKGGGNDWTITRTQESTAARTIIVGDQVMNAVTAKTISDIEALFTATTLGDTFMGNVLNSQSATVRDITLTASTDFSGSDLVEVGSSYSLEVPATSTLEVCGYYNANSAIPTKQLSNAVKFHVYQTTAQTTSSGADTVVNFDAKEFDTGGNFSLVSKAFTAPVAGFYQFNASVAWSNTASMTRGILTLYKNGSILKRIDDKPNTGATAGSASGGTHVQLAAGDTINVQLFSVGAGAILAVSQSTVFFSGLLTSTS